MSVSDIGPGDVLIALKSHPQGLVFEGHRYVCRMILTPDNVDDLEFDACQMCGDIQQVAIQLTEHTDYGWCHCLFRKIGGEDIFMTFIEKVLKPVYVPDVETPKIPEKV